MNLQDCLISADLASKHAIQPFTPDWQAALVAVGRAKALLRHKSSSVGALAAWSNESNTASLEMDGMTKLLLDLRLEAPFEGNNNMPGTGKVSLGIKCDKNWFADHLTKPNGPDEVAEELLKAASLILGRIHLMQPGVADENDTLISLGRTIYLHTDMNLGNAVTRMLHPTPWSNGATLATLDNEVIEVEAFDEPKPALPWILGFLENRVAGLPTLGPHAPMNLTLSPYSTTFNPKKCDPVLKLRALAAWEKTQN